MVRAFTDATIHDLRFALRSMARTPGFTAVALLMLAIGTGANAAMFSVVDAVMVRSPFVDPDRIAMVGVRTADGRRTAALTLEQYRSLHESTQTFDALAGMASGQRPVLSGLGEPRRFNVECFTAGMFHVLGTQPVAGRAFTADDDRPGAAAVVVISHQFWQREMGGAPDAVGRGIALDGTPATIVGIMPRAFGGPYSRNNNDGWMPAGPALAGGRTPGCSQRGSVSVFARVKAGVSFEAAAAQATAAGRVELLSLEAQTLSDVRTPLLALLGAVGLVLLIACANVANLQVERIFGRRAELGIRMALGASRTRIVRQTLLENLLLAGIGCIGGLLVARLSLDLLVALLPANMPRLNEIVINGRVLIVTFAVAVGAGLAVGVIPAIRGTSATLMDDLRSSVRTATGRAWTSRALVVVQLSLSLVLLVGASLMIRTFATLRPSSPGFVATDKLTATVRFQGDAVAAAPRFFEAALGRLRAIPGVRSVEGSTYLPLSGSMGTVSIRAGDVAQDVANGVVTPGYFAEMEIPIERGRAFGPGDTAGTPPVAIVNQAFARKWFPADEALGRIVEIEWFDKRRESRQIVGIVRDTRSASSDLRARPEIYEPLAQTPTPFLHFIVRASRPGDPRMAAAVRGAIAVDGSRVADRVIPMQDLMDARAATWRFGAWLLGVFAAMAVILAAIGFTASVAWWVTRRTREIGVRMALGANPRQVTWMVMAQGFGLSLTGVILGLAGAGASTRLIASWLYGVTPLDPATFVASAAGMLAIAAAASYIPARRATRIDPLVALRES